MAGEGTISAKVIHRPRKSRWCEGFDCGRRGAKIPAGTPVVRLYGCASYGDPLYTMYVCLECAKDSIETKTRRAVLDYEASHPKGEVKP